MFDDEAEFEADLSFIRLLIPFMQVEAPVPEDLGTGVLESAKYVYNNATSVAIDVRSTKKAAKGIYEYMLEKNFTIANWADNKLHPQTQDKAAVSFIFTMDLLNFSFWSDRPEDERFAIEYQGKQWVGYSSLLAALQRALEEGIPITDPNYWRDRSFTLNSLKHVFRSCTEEEIPLLRERYAFMREMGHVLHEVSPFTLVYAGFRFNPEESEALLTEICVKKYDSSFIKLIEKADGSAVDMVNLLADDFCCFRDEHFYEGREEPIRILKRAQILVADLWACFKGESFGKFHDIDQLTAFADYRIPQFLLRVGALYANPAVLTAIKREETIESGSSAELQLRACSIWCIELIRREIMRNNPEAKINSVMIDFFMYDTMKKLESVGMEMLPHHRTRSVWY